MLNNDTIAKLNEMHMGTMATGFAAQLADPQFQNLSFEERFSILVDAEWSSRKSNRLTKLIKKAGYSDSGAAVEDIAFTPERKLDNAQILRLSSCSYIQQAQNVIILGATGTGKTYLACALGMAANRNFYEVKYMRLPDLLVEIAIAREAGTYREVMKKYKKVSLLILDEWLLYSLTESEARDLLELIEVRNKVSSTIFCSQFDVNEWHASLYDPTMADAICDRIVYNSHTVKIEGDSMRKKAAIAD